LVELSDAKFSILAAMEIIDTCNGDYNTLLILGTCQYQFGLAKFSTHFVFVFYTPLSDGPLSTAIKI